MAIIAALAALGSKFAGKVLTTALGWSSTLLFGRVPADRRPLILGITFGSVLWMVLLVGVLVPAVGTMLLLFIPPQGFVPEIVIRLLMLAAAIILPGVVGATTLLLDQAADRTPRGFLAAIGRGYPLTAFLAVILVFLAGLAIWRKATSLARGRTDAHVPIVVEPGAYEQVAKDLDHAISMAGFDVTPGAAPASMSKPATWLTAVAGRGGSNLVPDQMVRLNGPDIDVLIYPMDVLISGKEEPVNRARAAIASRLTTSAAHLTTTAESQALEDRLAALVRPPADQPDLRPQYSARAATELEAVDRSLASLAIPYEEWEVLYRQRLQVERDLRAHAMEEDGAATDDDSESPSARLGRWLNAATDVLGAFGDDSAGKALERAVGPEVRVAVQTAATAATAARESLTERKAAITGEPLGGEPGGVDRSAGPVR
jgi:hypothetical protein